MTLPEYLTATNTFYVDPGTGAPVKVVEAQNETLQNPSTGGTALVLLSGTLTSTPQEHRHGRQHVEALRQRDIARAEGRSRGLACSLASCSWLSGIFLLIGEGREYYEYEDEDDEAVGVGA